MTYDQTHWVPVQQKRPLPTFYYHGHFIEMLDFVGAHYAHVLQDRHVAFLEDFRALPRDAQCLYVRLVNRKGRVFARRKIRYPELGEIAPLIDVLSANGWVGGAEPGHLDDVLGFLTRAELYDLLLPQFTGMSRSLKKAQLVDFAREQVDPTRFIASVDPDRVLVQRRTEEVRYLLYLYFGRVRNSLSQFTMRDLGLVRTQDFRDTYEPRFADRDQALEHYYFACRLESLKSTDAGTLARLGAEVDSWPPANFAGSAKLRDELAFKLGRQAEKAGNLSLAETLYGAGESTDCNERYVRLLLKEGRTTDARAYLERCLDDPRSDEEWLVARDLYERKFQKKRTSAVTDILRAAEQIDIDESRSGSPERAVIEYFQSLGVAAFRTENLIWRTLFGLLFWEELFLDDEASLHSPFEFLPASLANGTFGQHKAELIGKRLGLLDEPAALKRRLLKISTEHYGTPNGVFRWRRDMNEAVFALLDHAHPGSVAQVLSRMCQDYENSRYGYPDLMLIDRDGVRFIEVKAPGDHLRRNQLLRLQQLRGGGVSVLMLLRVCWVLDPGQAYVVVDVETTGGRGDRHRVTEIGAVRLRNGRGRGPLPDPDQSATHDPAGISSRLTGHHAGDGRRCAVFLGRGGRTSRSSCATRYSSRTMSSSTTASSRVSSRESAGLSATRSCAPARRCASCTRGSGPTAWPPCAGASTSRLTAASSGAVRCRGRVRTARSDQREAYGCTGFGPHRRRWILC